MRQALIGLEPGLASLLVVMAGSWRGVAALMATRASPGRARSMRRAERRVGRALARWGWAPAVLVWLLPLWSSRAGRPPDTQTAWQMPLGEIPWSDGYGYLGAAHQLLSDGRFSGFGEQKPIYPALLSAALGMTRGDLDVALSAMAVALGLASFLAARAIGARYGAACALAAFGLLLGLGRGVSPAVVTEPLGIVFGALALAVLVSTPARRDPRWFAAGLLLLTLGLQARPGAQFVAVFLVAWGVRHFRGQRGRALRWAAPALLGAILFTSVLGRWYGTGESSFYARPAFFAYGLARGANEEQVNLDFAERRRDFPSEGQFARFVLGEALSEFRRHPAVLVQSCLAGAWRVVEKNGKVMAGIANPTRIANSFRDRPRPGETAWPGRVLLIVLCALSVVRAVRGREALFWLAALGGTIASGAFVGNDNPVHGVAAVHPLIALAVALGLASSPPRLPEARRVAAPEVRTVRASLAFGLALALLALAGPAAARADWPTPTTAMLLGMQPGEDLVIAPQTSPAVAVGPGTLSFSRYRVLLEQSATHMDVVQPAPPFVILSAWDFVGRRQRVVYAPADVARAEGFVHLEVEEEKPAPNSQPVVRAGAWRVLGPWR